MAAWGLAALMLLLPASAKRIVEVSSFEVSSLADVDRADSDLAGNASHRASIHGDVSRASSAVTGSASDLVQRAVGNESAMSCHSFCVPCNDGKVVYLGRSKSVLKKIFDTTMVSLGVITWPLLFASAAYVAAEKAFADKLISVCPNLQIIVYDVGQTPKEAPMEKMMATRPDGLESPLLLFTKSIDDMYTHQVAEMERVAREQALREGRSTEAKTFWSHVKRFAVGERHWGQMPELLQSILDDTPLFCGGAHGGVVKAGGMLKIIEEGSFGSLGNAASDAFWGGLGYEKHNTGFAQTCFQASRSIPIQ